MKTNILGVYDDEHDVMHAVDKLQEVNITVKDVFSPFPLHGIWDKLNQTTNLPYATFVYGLIGGIGTFALLYWTSVISYPLKFGGKPLNTLSFIIIMFVLTILIGTVFTALTFFVRQKLYPGKESKMPDIRTVDDKFVIVIEKTELMDIDEITRIKNLLTETGAVEINESDVEYE
jgi:ActD protein